MGHERRCERALVVQAVTQDGNVAKVAVLECRRSGYRREALRSARPEWHRSGDDHSERHAR
jgi:hypothetical protein